jgi:hypothetical protein
MNLLLFIVLFTMLFAFFTLVFEHINDRLCALPSKFNRVLWCKNCDQIEIGESTVRLCSRCGCVCTVIKF